MTAIHHDPGYSKLSQVGDVLSGARIKIINVRDFRQPDRVHAGEVGKEKL